MKKLGLGVLMVMMLAAAAVYAQQQSSGGDLLQQMRDRAEIEDLMWRYTRALDTGNADAYAAAYTPDGVFTAGTTATKGRDALRKMVAGLNVSQPPAAGQPPRAPMYHMTTNHAITFIDKDSVRIDSYYLTAFGAAGQNTPLRVAAVGRSVDELVRVNGKWLIKSRNVAPQN
jgi:3-phenylpropionate/cinnamic acid dioxygenase small subunit